MRTIRKLLLAAALVAAAAGCAAPSTGGGGSSSRGSGPKADEGSSATLREAALRNLERVRAEIDNTQHLSKYGLQVAEDGTERSVPEQFLTALEMEYADQPDMLAARMRALASMVFFAAPDIAPPAEGTATPFHGMDMDDFEKLMRLEDQVWNQHEADNGHSKVGVRPFSVCETRFLIEEYVHGDEVYSSYEEYREKLATYVEESCTEEDLAYWYNFRGLGHLRPTWIESNIMERVVRRMVQECDAGEIDEEWTGECAKWHEDRFAYRNQVNLELSSRFFFYDAADEDYMEAPSNQIALFEDVDGDGIGEFVRPGPSRTVDGEEVTVHIDSTGQFSGRMRVVGADGTSRNIAPGNVVLETRRDPGFDPAFFALPDLGLQALFTEPNPTGGTNGCASENPDPEQCPLLKRFYVMIDRHESFYQTYSALRPTYNGRYSLASQPSPLVACSVTIAASHHWDSAGIPSGGTAGFIFLMKVPFAQILAGSDKSISSLPTPPDVLSVQDLYAGTELDMSRVWLDIASLSNDLYESENEISKYGAVHASQIEGILVVRRPAAMTE